MIGAMIRVRRQSGWRIRLARMPRRYLKYKPLMFAVIGLIVLYTVYHVWSHREKREEEAPPKKELEPSEN